MRHISYLLAAVSVFALAVTSSAWAQDLFDCEHFPSQQAAQEEFRQNPDDPYGLDGPPGYDAFEGIQGVACERNPAPEDLTPVPPPGIQGVGEQKELFEAGGDLPLPGNLPVSTTAVAEEDDNWPAGLGAAITISAGLLALALYRLATNRQSRRS